jgi:hypothetical protein
MTRRSCPGSPRLAPADSAPAGADQLADAYLAEVAARLPGPARARASIIAELRAGLLDATDAHHAAGLPPGRAAAAAISEFGDPRQLASAFRPGLAASQARQVALTLLATGPLIGLLWAVTALASHIGIHDAPPWHWAGAPPASNVGFPAAAAAFWLTMGTALLTIAATGRLTRWLPRRPRLAPSTAALAGLGAAAADLALLTLLASQLAAGPGALAPVPAAAAALASVTRLTLAGRGARRCLTARATLTR